MRFILVILLACSTLSCALSTASTPQTMGDGEPKPNVGETPSLEKKSRNNDSKIIAGERIGSVALGDTIDEVNGTLEPASRGPILSTYEGCTKWFGTWFIGEAKKDYLHIEFDESHTARRFRTYAIYLATTDGITSGDDSKSVKEKYKNPNDFEAFISFGLRSTNNPHIEGWPMYWVDQSKGIAFEFVRTKKEKNWLLQSISIFEPSDTFRGNYCNRDDRYWKKFGSLNPSNSEILKIEQEHIP